EIGKGRRSDSRLVIILVSDGHSQDDWALVQSTAKKVHDSGAEIYAVTLSKDYSREELELYTGDPAHLYVDDRIKLFVEAAAASVGECPVKGQTTAEPAVTTPPAPQPETTTAAPVPPTTLP
uniref:VWFA domain-containing protein n=1 Tax=Plectus sambesii TaxID=2011161 RepID=A0A914VJC5_9BILA